MNNFKRFTLLGDKDDQQHGSNEEVILLNIDHIISIKPINIVVEGEVVHGYWIRTTNGKKYRAISIPKELKTLV